MRGTDCTPEQVQRASEFLAARGWPEGIPMATQSRDDIVRLIAWYGALRYDAGTRGLNSLEAPGELVTKGQD